LISAGELQDAKDISWERLAAAHLVNARFSQAADEAIAAWMAAYVRLSDGVYTIIE
jgi:hypothetical protein